MEFLLFRLKGNRVKDGVVLTADWNEKVVRDFVVEDREHRSDEHPNDEHPSDEWTCVCPVGHIPPAVSKRHVGYCRKHSVPPSKTSALAGLQSKITDRNREAFADPLGYVKDYPVYGLLFLREALKREERAMRSLTRQIKQVRTSGMPPEPMCPASVADLRKPKTIEKSVIKSLEEQKESVSQLVKEIQAEMKHLESEPGEEPEIPVEFWGYLDDSAADAGTDNSNRNSSAGKDEACEQETLHAEGGETPAAKKRKRKKAKQKFDIDDIRRRITGEYPSPDHVTAGWLTAEKAAPKAGVKAGVKATTLTEYRSRADKGNQRVIDELGILGCDDDGRVFFKYGDKRNDPVFYYEDTVKPGNNAFKTFYK